MLGGSTTATSTTTVWVITPDIGVPVKVSGFGMSRYRVDYSNGTSVDLVHGDWDVYDQLVRTGEFDPRRGGPRAKLPVSVGRWSVEQLDAWIREHA